MTFLQCLKHYRYLSNKNRFKSFKCYSSLAENLNIDISAQQEIETQRHQRIFSTGTGVQFSAVLKDNFTNPVVYHSWIFTGPATIKPVVNSTKSQIEIHGQKAGIYTLNLDAEAEYNVTEWGPIERRHKEGNVTYLFEFKGK